MVCGIVRIVVAQKILLLGEGEDLSETSLSVVLVVSCSNHRHITLCRRSQFHLGNYWQRHKRPRPVEYSTDPEFHLTPITTANIAKLEAQTASVLPRPLDDDRPWSFVSTASSPSESSIVGLVGVDGGSDCYPSGTPSASNSVGAAVCPFSLTQFYVGPWTDDWCIFFQPPIAPEWIKRAMEDLRAKYPGGEFDAISRKTKPEKPDDWRIRCHDCPTMVL